MCPVCTLSAATLTATVVSGGGVTAVLIKLRNKILPKVSRMKNLTKRAEPNHRIGFVQKP